MAIPGGISLGFDGIGGLPVQPEMAIRIPKVWKNTIESIGLAIPRGGCLCGWRWRSPQIYKILDFREMVKKRSPGRET